MMYPDLPAWINILLVAGATAGAIAAIFALAARFSGLVRWLAAVVTRAVRDVMDQDLTELRGDMTALGEQVRDVGKQVEQLDARVAENHAYVEDEIRRLDRRVARLEGGSRG